MSAFLLLNGITKSDLRKEFLLLSENTKVLQVKALAGLSLFTEAIQHLEDIYTLRKLPKLPFSQHKLHSHHQKFGKFDNTRKIVDPQNLQVLKELTTCQLTASQMEAFGVTLTQRVEIICCELLITLAETIYAIPDESSTRAKPDIKEDKSEPKRSSGRVSKTPSLTKAGSKKSGRTKLSTSDTSPTRSAIAQITEDNQPPVPAKVKGMLLANAAKNLNRLLESIQGLSSSSVLLGSGMNAESLECYCLCKLQLARIANQRLFSIPAAKHVFSAMKIMESFSVAEDVDDAGQINPSISNGRMTPASLISGQGAPTNANTNIDARFWLQCRLMLATSLGGQDDSGGKLGDFVNNTTKKIGTCTYHIKQGIKECDAFGYTEMECQFKLLAKTNDIKAGADGLEIVKNLEDIEKEIASLPAVSMESQIQLAKTKILKADIESHVLHNACKKDELMQSYRNILQLLLNMIMLLGNNVDLKDFTPTRPFKTIYSTYLPLLGAIKLRISKLMTVAEDMPDKFGIDHWLAVNKELQDCIDIFHVSARSFPLLEAEALLLKGD